MMRGRTTLLGGGSSSSSVGEDELFYNVQDHGWDPDGTDHSSEALTLLSAVSSAGGGTIYFPPGTYRCDSQFLIPNTAGSPTPTQVNIRLTGAGGGNNWYQNVSGAAGAAILDLRYTGGSGGKIETRGRGVLMIDNLVIKDGGASNTNSLLHSTNTTLVVRNNSFHGSGNTSQDAIVLGGSITTINDLSTGAFQGYGTIIEGNVFTELNRGVYGRTYANSVQIHNNSFIHNVGTRAIEFDGSADAASGDWGLNITGNTIEMDVYDYGVYLKNVKYSHCSGNSFWDAHGAVVAGYYLTDVSTQNVIILSGVALGTTKDVQGDSDSLKWTTIIGGVSGRRDTSNNGEASAEFANNLVIKGDYASGDDYPGQLFIKDRDDDGKGIVTGFDLANLRGVLDVKSESGPTGLELRINPTGGVTKFGATISPLTSDAAALGTTSLMFSDLFLASGGVINWNNGGMTLTHSTNTLTLINPTASTGKTTLRIESGADQSTGSTDLLQVQFVGSVNNLVAINSSGTLRGATNANGITWMMITDFGGVSQYRMVSGGLLGFNSTSNLSGGALDTGIARNAAGVLEVNSGTNGTLRDLRARQLVASGDSAGTASSTTFTNTTNLTVTNDYIVRGGQAASTVNTGWAKIYVGTNAAWVPYWQNATP